jgi:hypothetical protein
MSRKKIRKSGRGKRGYRSLAPLEGNCQVLACEDCGCGLLTFAVPIGSGKLDDFGTYMDAHHLMPFDYDYDPETCGQIVGEAIVASSDRRLEEAARLAAIAILGHSPCAEALAALDSLAASDDRLAGVAEFALGECQGLAEAFGMGDRAVGTLH